MISINHNTPNLPKINFKALIAELTMFDDILAQKTLQDIKVMQYVLRIILDNEDLIVKEVTTQDTLTGTIAEGRTVILDVLATDSTGKKYNIEVQQQNKGASPKRARYHSSMIDATLLKQSQDFDELTDTYVIFITKQDYFKQNAPLYHFVRKELTTNTLLNDNTNIIYVNGSYKGKGKLADLMQDFNTKDVDKMHESELKRSISYFKKTQEGEKQMSEIMQQLYNQGADYGRMIGLDEGMEKGRTLGLDEGKILGLSEGIKKGEIVGKEQKTYELAEKMLLAGKLDLCDIAEYTGLTVEQLNKLKDNI